MTLAPGRKEIILKREKLDEINMKYLNAIYNHFRNEVPLVFGDGNTDSQIVLVGEAPGKTEISQGKPFVGQAGKNLEQFITILGIDRKDIYITNVVKFRPFKINQVTGREANRSPLKDEINISKDFIEQELSVIKPEIVVSLGNIALRCILKDDKVTIGFMHGVPISVQYTGGSFILFPLYHPASIIYNRALKDVYLQDLYKLRGYIKK